MSYTSCANSFDVDILEGCLWTGMFVNQNYFPHRHQFKIDESVLCAQVYTQKPNENQ